MKIAFYLHNKCSRTGECPIFWRYSFKSKKVRVSTGRRIHPSRWKDGLPKTTTHNDRSLRKLLLKWQQEIQEIVDTFQLQDKDPWPHLVKEEWDRKRQQITVGQVWVMFEKEHLSKKAKNTQKNFSKTLNNFKAFGADWNDFDADWGDRFIDYLMDEKGNSRETATKKLSRIAQFLRFASKKGYLKDQSFELWEKHKKRSKKKIFLTKEEIDQIRKIPMPNERLQKAKDLLIFHCITGLAYVDGQTLDKSLIDLEERRMELSRMKTGVDFDLPMNDEMIEILQKYNGLPEISNQKLNEYLKEVGELASIDKPVKYRGKMVPKHKAIISHTGRTSFITNGLLSGIPLHLMSKLVGHKSIKTTMEYDQSGYEELKEAMEGYK